MNCELNLRRCSDMDRILADQKSLSKILSTPQLDPDDQAALLKVLDALVTKARLKIRACGAS